MSCNCNAKYDNKIPCCCSTGTAVVCTTTICPNTQPCNQTIEIDCIIYNGNHYDCAGITSGMTVTEIMNIIYTSLNLIDCTTTIPIDCQCYLLINNTEGSQGYTYTPCDETPISGVLLSGQRKYLCSSVFPTVNDNSIGTINTLICTGVRANCSNPKSYCHTIEVTGTASFQYINSLGILTTVGVSDESVVICAWQNSIDKISGTGVYTITPSDNECPFGACD